MGKKQRKIPADGPDLVVSLAMVLTRGPDDTALASGGMSAEGDPDLVAMIQSAAPTFHPILQSLNRAIVAALGADLINGLPDLAIVPSPSRHVGRA